MTVLYYSDMHLGYTRWADQRWEETLTDVAKQNDIAVVLLGGDLGSHDISHELNAFRLASRIFPEAKIVWVAGNHTFYGGHDCPQDTLLHLKKHGEKLGVRYLPDEPLIFGREKLAFFGWSGWYEELPKSSNDPHQIRNYWDNEYWLKSNAKREFERATAWAEVLKSDGCKTIGVTHFNCFAVPDWKSQVSGEYWGAPREWESELGCFDAIYYGHTHRKFDGLASNGTTQLINAGADYCVPACILLDL